MNPNVKVTLIISIVLNVLLAGMIMGDVSHHFIAAPSFDYAAALAQLPPGKRAIFENTMGPAKQRMDKEHAAIGDAKKEALRLLKAEPFDPIAYLAQTRHIDEMLVQMKQHMAQAVATLARQLTAHEREIMADIISHPPFANTPPSQAGKEGR
jgi:uncharacterized membrane protein